MTEHVQQRNAFDCGVAAIATLTGRQYGQVADVDPNPHVARGYWVAEVVEMLSQLTRQPYWVTRVANRPVAEYQPRPCAGLLFLQGPDEPDWGHWVAFFRSPGGVTIYDPAEYWPHSAETCKRAQWRVKRLIWRAADSGSLPSTKSR